CRTYAATRSLEHGHANGFFELTNATAQRRLPHKQCLGSSAEASIFRGNYGVSEVLEGDHRGFIANRQVLAFWFANHSRSSDAFERAAASTRYSESGDFRRSVVFFVGPQRAGYLRNRGPQPIPSGRFYLFPHVTKRVPSALVSTMAGCHGSITLAYAQND